MTRTAAIKKLISQGYTEQVAVVEFNGMVNWYLRGTLRTVSDIKYATECAIEDILDN